MASAVTVTKGARGDFGWMFQLLSAVMGTLAIVALGQHAVVTWSLSAPMTLVMDAYHSTMQLLLGWAQPYLQAILTWLGSFIGWRPTLYTHWRDVLVVLGLLGVGCARCGWREEDWADTLGYLLMASFFGCAAFVASVVAGLLPLNSDRLAVQMLIAGSFAIVPSIVLFFRAVLRLERNDVDHTAAMFVIPSVMPVLATLAFSEGLGSASGAGLASLASLMIFIGAMLVMAGGMLEKERDHPALIVGITILGGFIGAALFFGIDAGLKLLMG